MGPWRHRGTSLFGEHRFRSIRDRLRRWQIRERLEKRGPLRLRVELKMRLDGRKPSERSQFICVERSYALFCRTPEAVAYVRRRLKALMEEMDGISLPPHDSEHGFEQTP